MDTYRISLVPGMLASIQNTKKFIDWVSAQIFEELGMSVEGRGRVEYCYIERFWYLADKVVCILRPGEADGLEDGAVVLDHGTEVGPYRVFKMTGQNGIDLIVLDGFLEKKVAP